MRLSGLELRPECGRPNSSGTNRNEGTEFVTLPTDATEVELAAFLRTWPLVSTHGGDAAVADVLAQYPPSRFPPSRFASSAWWRASGIFTDSCMTCAARRSAAWLSRANRSSAVYLYHLEHKLELTAAVELDQKKPLGVFHGERPDDALMTP